MNDFLINEIESIKVELSKLEEKLLDFESKNLTNSPAYIRYSNEKKELLNNLCQFRLQIASSYHYHSYNLRKRPSSLVDNTESFNLSKKIKDNKQIIYEKSEISGYTDTGLSTPANNNELDQDVSSDLPYSKSSSIPNVSTIPSVVPPPTTSAPAPTTAAPAPSSSIPSPPSVTPTPATTSTTAAPTTNNSTPASSTAPKSGIPDTKQPGSPRKDPQLQTEEYNKTKQQLSKMMQEFRKGNIYLISVNDKLIDNSEYDRIANVVKSGEDITKHLKGVQHAFLTAIDPKKRAVTEVKLFVPDHKVVEKKE